MSKFDQMDPLIIQFDPSNFHRLFEINRLNSNIIVNELFIIRLCVMSSN